MLVAFDGANLVLEGEDEFAFVAGRVSVWYGTLCRFPGIAGETTRRIWICRERSAFMSFPQRVARACRQCKKEMLSSSVSIGFVFVVVVMTNDGACFAASCGRVCSCWCCFGNMFVYVLDFYLGVNILLLFWHMRLHTSPK